KGSALLGVIVGVAMLLNMIAATVAGVLVPLSLRALRIDPALASSIMVTTVTDVAGFFFFLGLAKLVTP
ncbi:MAG: magnesium transporter, partial [Verrucomicrobiota bacterium]|nr:magnesium transporter [Verrucomicrobiota bacterium]